MLAVADEIDWGYEGEIGPEHWGSLDPSFATCAEGAAQSPIDLRPTILRSERNVLRRNLPPIRFEYEAIMPFSVLNNGHTIEVPYEEGGFIGTGRRRFELLQFHFHAPSEHTVEGGAEYPMEMHLVHQHRSGRLAVVALFVRRGAENQALARVWDELPDEAGEEIAVGALLDVGDVLPADRRYYRYDGSLTTPPCTEGVLWHVLLEPIEMSTEQIDAFVTALEASCCRRNNRPAQPLNGRRVVLDGFER